MRWWKIFCLSILIASALALSANAQLPRPNVQREAQLADSGQQQSNPAQAQAINSAAPAVAEPAKPAVQTPEANNSPTEIQQNRENKKLKEFDWITFWDVVRTALQILFTAITTIATVYLAKFSYELVTVTKDLHSATKAATEASVKSAAAAEKNVEVAEKALYAQRPFLRIEQIGIVGLDDPQLGLGGSIWKIFARFIIQNRGSGIGLIKNLKADFRLRKLNEEPRLDNLQDVLYGPPIVGANGVTQNLYAPAGSDRLVITDAERQEFFADRTRLLLVGTLVYTDMAESVEYTFAFSWCYGAPKEDVPDGVWYQYPDKLNRETETKKPK